MIQADDLHVEYASSRKNTPGTKAVDGVSFSVHGGEIFGFLGPNGAGKTTTISVLTTLLSPTSGRATVAGIDTVAAPAEVRRRIGLVFQTSTADAQLTGRENLTLEAGLYGLRPSEVADRIDELLRQVELTAVADRLVGTYSGGMRRRLELAAGLVHGPHIVFLDEPTLGLDPQGRAGFWKYIRELRDSKGITVFLTTHYLDEADQLCDRIAIIDNGHIIATGTPAELKDRMGGDTLEIGTAAGAADLTSALGAIPGVSAVARVEGGYRLKCARGEALVSKVVVAAQSGGVEITRLAVHKPSLDEVFLHLTGHAYREEGNGKAGATGAPGGR
ncbi:MAG TPA: ATP-binding cassette domain-containing protein [Thermoplasmata archaeon]|nr:ATP-binding cassette domain-containing protein [Thermoplasmata archaeon]